MTSERSRKILIVEDDFATRTLLLKLLSEFGSCDVAIDGNETFLAYAMAYGAGEPYSLISMDIGLPDIDGLHIVEKVREFEKEQNIDKKAVILATTGAEMDESTKGAYSRFDGFVPKPIDRHQLTDTLIKLDILPID